ncbi:MAG: M24 family metallopeptidase, partial [Gammaproteobacteria bacterium]|nr:M24 family metallopeptidase [Gammaproteobacteria bacterium]
KAMYALAREELAHNTELLQPGRTLQEIAQRAFAVPAEYKENSYAFVAHGIGLCDEWPNCYQLEILEERGEGDIVIEVGMTLCVESYIGETGGPDGIKLEEQVLVTESGPVTLSRFPFETAMAG